MRSGSLKLRLLAAAAVSVALALLLAGLALSRIFETEVRARVMRELDNHLLQLAGLIEADDAGVVSVSGPLADPRFEKPESGLYWQVKVKEPAQLLVSASLFDEEITLEPDAGGRGVTTAANGEALLYARRAVTLAAGGRTLAISLLAATHESEVALATVLFQRSLALSLSAIGLALVAAAWAQVTIGLRPLQVLRDGLAAVRSGAAQRLSGDVPDEVAPLVGEFNGVLEAQAQSLERARARAGDLAHGLKTPLTVLSALARDIARAGLATEAAEIEEQTETMRRHTERQLVRARLATGRAVAATPLAPAVERVVAAMRRSPRGGEIAWAVDIPASAAVAVEAQDLIELLGNLLDNARKWAGAAVEARWSEGRLSIADDGPGIAEDDLARIESRGLRLDEKTQGSGLGLAIVRDIADLYGLGISYGRGEAGGLAVMVEFARPAPVAA